MRAVCEGQRASDRGGASGIAGGFARPGGGHLGAVADAGGFGGGTLAIGGAAGGGGAGVAGAGGQSDRLAAAGFIDCVHDRRGAAVQPGDSGALERVWRTAVGGKGDYRALAGAAVASVWGEAANDPDW